MLLVPSLTLIIHKLKVKLDGISWIFSDTFRLIPGDNVENVNAELIVAVDLVLVFS